MKNQLISLLLVFGMATPLADAAECTKLEAYAAETVTDYLDSWKNVYYFFKQFHHCYDGSIAEGAEDKIQELWSDHWPNIDEMVVLTTKDAKFKEFIWQRISDETFSQERFRRFVKHATKECPAGAEEFCHAVINESAKIK
jgi:hypothetical protein